jgi:hypothetical protein
VSEKMSRDERGGDESTAEARFDHMFCWSTAMNKGMNHLLPPICVGAEHMYVRCSMELAVPCVLLRSCIGGQVGAG